MSIDYRKSSIDRRWVPTEVWAWLLSKIGAPPDDQRQIIYLMPGATMEEFKQRWRDAARAGGFETPQKALARLKRQARERGWPEP